MKISILSPDLSHNCLGRAYLLAKILQRHYEVEIVGPNFGDGIWQPVVNDKSITYKSVKIVGRFKPYLHIRELAQKIDGDVIYASKPLFTSFGIGVLIKVVQKKPLILDIDDWEMGFKKESNKNLSLFSSIKSFVSFGLFRYGMGRYWNILFKEKLVSFSNEIIVSNTFLKNKFGGTKVVQKKPLILDIDDWEMHFKKESNKNLSLFRSIRAFVSSGLFRYGMGCYWNILFMEKLAYFSNEITISNTFLKNKFGGTMVCHGRDTEAFDPKQFNRDLVRKKYGIEKTNKIIMFLGTPKSHKGIGDLIKAVGLIKNQDIILVVVGIDNRNQYSKTLAKTTEKVLGKRFKGFGLQPFEIVPEFLVMADVVVIPQRKNSSTMGQMPAKVFDAMAMAKPIIASNISDLPEILDGCGWIVKPENPKELAKKIQYVLNNPEEAEEMGNKARQKCIEKYSWNAMEEIFLNLFKKYERVFAGK